MEKYTGVIGADSIGVAVEPRALVRDLSFDGEEDCREGYGNGVCSLGGWV